MITDAWKHKGPKTEVPVMPESSQQNNSTFATTEIIDRKCIGMAIGLHVYVLVGVFMRVSCDYSTNMDNESNRDNLTKTKKN